MLGGQHGVYAFSFTLFTPSNFLISRSIVHMGLCFDGSFYTKAIVAAACQLPLDLTRVLSIAPPVFANILFTLMILLRHVMFMYV